MLSLLKRRPDHSEDIEILYESMHEAKLEILSLKMLLEEHNKTFSNFLAYMLAVLPESKPISIRPPKKAPKKKK